MAEKIYFAGGFYATRKTDGDDEYEFDMVSGGFSRIPYLTKSQKGLRTTAHHANLYELSEDGATATVVDIRCPSVGASKHTVVLSLEQQQLMQDAIKAGHFFD